jgi:hypothetical protein
VSSIFTNSFFVNNEARKKARAFVHDKLIQVDTMLVSKTDEYPRGSPNGVSHKGQGKH